MPSWVREVVRFLVCACALWALLPARTRAEPLRALLRITQPGDELLFERVRGQTSDLELVLVRRETGPLEPGIAEQLLAARQLGSAESAQIVIWFARERSEQLEVRVLDLAAERVLSRSIERGAGTLGESAQDEAAALVVRSAARASLLGAALGSPEQELAEPTAPPVVAPRAQPPTRAAAREVELAAPAPLRFRAGGGAYGAFEGEARFGLGVRLAVAFAAFELGVRGGYGFASRSRTPVAQVELAQHRAGLYAAFAPMVRSWLQLVLELGADLQIFTTRVRVDDPLFDGRAPRALLPGANAQLSARTWLHPRVALGLGLGVELLPNTPVLGYDSSAGFVRVREPWLLQPLLALELMTRF